MLELKGLSYQVEDNGVKTEILRGIDLTIEDNKFVVITGPNGGGKTTLAKTIMGLPSPPAARLSGTARIFPACPSPNGPSWGSAMGSSSPPGSRGCGCGTCWSWPRASGS